MPADVSAAEVADFYREVAAFSDETIADLPLDAPGAVPWWPEDRRDVSLARIIVHVISDITRHAGHADILREGIDGAAGLGGLVHQPARRRLGGLHRAADGGRGAVPPA